MVFAGFVCSAQRGKSDVVTGAYIDNSCPNIRDAVKIDIKNVYLFHICTGRIFPSRRLVPETLRGLGGSECQSVLD